MSWRDRLLSTFEDFTGMEIVPREEVATLRESTATLAQFRDEAEELAWVALEEVGGTQGPPEQRLENRRRLAKRSRRALRRDPLAGAEADLLSNFGFGRGVSKPDAADESVQVVIDEAWEDPVNVDALTGFEAIRYRSNELLTQANLYAVAYLSGGKVRIGFIDPDKVLHVINDPENEERPLWYVVRDRKQEWDFKEHRAKIDVTGASTDPTKNVKYFAHWRNVEDWAEERKALGKPITEEDRPAAELIADGVVFHVRINRIGRTQFGTPPWARTLRFFSALNAVTESHVAMAQAASSIIAKRVQTGGPDALRKSASAMLSMTGELGASSRFRQALRDTPEVEEDGPLLGPAGKRGPIGPGAFWMENGSDRLESLKLSSGAGEATQTAQIVRAPISAASQFGQHYLGDASNANLATATSLELPALMNVQAWQETFEQLYRWFIDLVIREAVRSGRLGGVGSDMSEAITLTPLSEMDWSNPKDKQEAERRADKDLSYVFEMPYPGRRNLSDVVDAVTSVTSSFDPNGINVTLRRELLLFFARDGLQLPDPSKFVDEVMPEDSADGALSTFMPAGSAAAAGGEPGQTGALGGDATGAQTGVPQPQAGNMAAESAVYAAAMDAAMKVLQDRAAAADDESDESGDGS